MDSSLTRRHAILPDDATDRSHGYDLVRSRVRGVAAWMQGAAGLINSSDPCTSQTSSERREHRLLVRQHGLHSGTTRTSLPLTAGATVLAVLSDLIQDPYPLGQSMDQIT